MKYNCPKCGFEMQPILCECKYVVAYHCYYEGGRLIHKDCNLPIDKKTQEYFENWKDKKEEGQS